jgi:hypothetical protein
MTMAAAFAGKATHARELVLHASLETAAAGGIELLGDLSHLAGDFEGTVALQELPARCPLGVLDAVHLIGNGMRGKALRDLFDRAFILVQ